MPVLSFLKGSAAMSERVAFGTTHSMEAFVREEHTIECRNARAVRVWVGGVSSCGRLLLRARADATRSRTRPHEAVQFSSRAPFLWHA